MKHEESGSDSDPSADNMSDSELLKLLPVKKPNLALMVVKGD